MLLFNIIQTDDHLSNYQFVLSFAAIKDFSAPRNFLEHDENATSFNKSRLNFD